MRRRPPDVLDAISPAPFRARLEAMCREDPEIEVLSWILGPSRFLEWGHTLGLVSDPGLRSTLPPLPPPELRAITASVQEAVFLWTGLFDVRALVALWERHGPGWNDRRLRVLDFGCGCGRLTRFLDQHENVTSFATDINASLANWCRSTLGRTRTTRNDASPPLAYASSSFDLVISLSVFTHLPAEAAAGWVAEMARLLSAGGLLVLTTHGYTALQTIGGSAEHQGMFRVGEDEVADITRRLLLEGLVFVPYEPDVLAVAQAGEAYGNAFTSAEHIAQAWCDGPFELVEHQPGGLRGWQDVVALRRR